MPRDPLKFTGLVAGFGGDRVIDGFGEGLEAADTSWQCRI